MNYNLFNMFGASPMQRGQTMYNEARANTAEQAQAGQPVQDPRDIQAAQVLGQQRIQNAATLSDNSSAKDAAAKYLAKKQTPPTATPTKASGTSAQEYMLKEKAKAKKRKVRFGEGDSMTIAHKGKRMANVSAEQLKSSGLNLTGYMNMWKQLGQRPTPESLRQALVGQGE